MQSYSMSGAKEALLGRQLVVQRPTPARRSRAACQSIRAAKGDDSKGAGGSLFGDLGAALSSGTQKLTAGLGAGTQKLKRGGSSGGGALDNGTVFVAGATGRLGARIVRELLSQGFKVRAGVRDLDKADSFIDTASSYGLLSADELSRLSVVRCDLEDAESIRPALGPADKVVCAVGASESELTDFSAPRRIDGAGATRLVEAATAAGVSQFILVTSLGTGKLGWPAGALNLFGGVLVFKRKAEEALEASGLPYVIVRPGGMERPRDDFKRTHNMRLATRDKLFGGLVSRLQVAELIATCVANPELADNKVLEVVAETTAPALSYEELLASHPAEQTAEEREAERVARAELVAALEAARDRLAAAEGGLVAARARVAEATAAAGEAKAREAAVAKEQGEVLKEAAAAERELAQLAEAADKAGRAADAAKAALAAAQQAQREGRLLGAKELAAVRQAALAPPQPQEQEEQRQQQRRGGTQLLGGLFGTQQKAAAAAEEEAQEAPAPAKKPAKPAAAGLFGFGAKKTAPAEEVAEEAEAADVASAPAAAPAKKVGGLFDGFFVKPQPKLVVEEEVVVEEEEEAVEERAPAPAPSKPGLFDFFKPREMTEEEKAARAAAMAEAQVKADEEAAARAAEVEAARRAAAEAAAARAAEAEAARRAAAEAAAARAAEEEAKRKVAAEVAAARAAEEEAKRKAAAEAAAAQKAAAEAKRRAEEEAQAQAAAEAKAAAEEAAVRAADVAARKAEAQRWIAAWRERTAVAAKAAPAAPAAAAEDMPPNVAEARAWIAAWKAKQQN